MPDVPEGVVVLALEISWHLPFLPYSKPHAAFMEHAHECPTCERVIHNPEAVPEGEDIDEHLCEPGRELAAAVHEAIATQHKLSLRN